MSEAGKNAKSRRRNKSKFLRENRDSMRRPRALKDQSKQPPVTRDTVKAAHTFLIRTGWCWKALSFKHCQGRGHGRKFVRCSHCGAYRDVLAWSYLPVLRMPLPAVVEAMKQWFTGSLPPSVEDVGRLLGFSGMASTSLRSLLLTLAKHEAALAVELINLPSAGVASSAWWSGQWGCA